MKGYIGFCAIKDIPVTPRGQNVGSGKPQGDRRLEEKGLRRKTGSCGRVLHCSPQSPAAVRGWLGKGLMPGCTLETPIRGGPVHAFVRRAHTDFKDEPARLGVQDGRQGDKPCPAEAGTSDLKLGKAGTIQDSKLVNDKT